MKQLVQDLMHGKIKIIEGPNPSKRENFVLIRSEISLISLGTEKMLLDFGKAGLISKARQQPEKVKQVLDKIKTDGILSTYNAVTRKLKDPIPLGYSNVGKVIGVGKNVENISVGDRVLSNGPHAEIVSVPSNLVCKVPNDVKSEDAVFGVVGAIALQSVRLMKPNIGETVCVMGLGLIGTILVQILLANGCDVIVIEKNKRRLSLLKSENVKKINISTNNNLEKEINEITNGNGVDGVIVATATKSNQPCVDAIKITRSKGKIIVVGTTGMNVDRDMLFKKEISLQVSRSYGPGRYDSKYEDKNQDYPLDHVRWTAGRNFEAFLFLLSSKRISLSELTKQKYNFEDALVVYEKLKLNNDILGTILDFSNIKNQVKEKHYNINNKEINGKKLFPSSQKKIGFIGSGNYAQSFLLPGLIKAKADLKTLVSRNPVSASYLGEKFKFKNISSEIDDIMKDDDINTVFIVTNHDSHSELVLKSLKNNKIIYVEKPLCINIDELNSIIKQYKTSQGKLFVGFNRRFAPYYQLSRSLLSNHNSPSVINIMINAGIVPKDHWVNDIKIGGGRIIGEMCHFLDLIVYLTGSLIIDINASYSSHAYGKNIFSTLKLANGSIGNIHYITNGNRRFPKERVEIFQSEKIILVNNFKWLKFYGFKNLHSKFSFRQNKGVENMIKAFLNNDQNNEFSSMQEIVNITKASFEIDKLIK